MEKRKNDKIEPNEIRSWWAGDPFKVERLSLSSKEMLTEGSKFDQIPMISIQRKELDDGNE